MTSTAGLSRSDWPRLEGALGEFQEQLKLIRRRARSLTANLSDEAGNWRPASGRWSVCECLDHLVKAADIHFPAIDRAIVSGRERRLTGAAPLHPGWLGRLLINFSEPPVRSRIKTFATFLPGGNLTVDEVVSRFDEAQDGIERRLAEADDLDLNRIKLWSPAVPLLRVSLGVQLALLMAHERRHLWQAEQVMVSPEFPG